MKEEFGVLGGFVGFFGLWCFFVFCFFLGGRATSVYLKHTNLSISADLTKKGKFYKTQVAILQLVSGHGCGQMQ